MDEICLSCLVTDFETSFESMGLSVQGECKMYSKLPSELPLLPWESTTEALENVTNARLMLTIPKESLKTYDCG